jgi:hypothetical protein
MIGDSPIHGPEGIRFCTRPEVAAGFDFPTSS